MKNGKLNPREEAVMQALWKMENAFIKDILNEFSDPKPPYNTISSIVRKLEDEGLIGHEAFGKTHRYFPILRKEEYRKSSFKSLFQNYFSSSPHQLLSFFVDEEIDIDELSEILEIIKKNEA